MPPSGSIRTTPRRWTTRAGRPSSRMRTDDRVVAIGETGLDYDRVFSPIHDQLANLRRNLALALETGEARDPPLPIRRRAARRAGRAAGRAARGRGGGRPLGRGVRRPSAGHHPLLFRAARLRPGRDRPRVWPSASRGSSSGAGRRRRPRSRRSSRPTACSSRPIRRSWRHPAHRGRATNRSGSASQRRGSRSVAASRSTTSGPTSSPPTTERSRLLGGPHDSLPRRLGVAVTLLVASCVRRHRPAARPSCRRRSSPAPSASATPPASIVPGRLREPPAVTEPGADAHSDGEADTGRRVRGRAEDGRLSSDRLPMWSSRPRRARTSSRSSSAVPRCPDPPDRLEVISRSRSSPTRTAGSGEDIDMEGDRVLQLGFLQHVARVRHRRARVRRGREFRPDLTVLRHAVVYDETEGVVGWYVGYDGPGCVTLGRDGRRRDALVREALIGRRVGVRPTGVDRLAALR